MIPGEDPLATDVPPAPPAKSTGMTGKFAQAFRRQTDEEREARRKKAERSKKELGRSKTTGGRMDIIDQMDLSGIHGSSMFHHDSPYDACSPHANRSSKKAPVKAFDPNTDPMTGLSLNSSSSRAANQQGHAGNRRGLSPLAASTLHRMDTAESGGLKDSGKGRPGQVTGVNRSFTSPMVPSLPMQGHDASSSAVNLHSSETASLSTDASHIDRDADAERNWRSQQGYYTQPSNVPSSRADVSNPVADVWGVSSEPWQDFAQPKAQSRRPSGVNGARSRLGPYGNGEGVESAASSVLDMEAVLTGNTSNNRPSPSGEIGGVSPFPEPDYNKVGGGDNAPKRSKSLMKRIKSARQYGNVPPPDDDVLEMQGRRAARAHKYSPSSPAEGSKGSAGDWSSLTASNLGAGSGATSLGRNGTRRATKDEQVRYAERNGEQPGSVGSNNGAAYGSRHGYFENANSGGNPHLSPEESAGYGSADGRGGRSAETRGNGAGVGRSGSIFGRFGRKKSNDNRVLSR